MKVDKDIAKKALDSVIKALGAFDNFSDQEAIKACLTAVISELNLKNGQVLYRLARL